MKRIYKLALVLFLVSMLAGACSKNYYTTKAKGNDCGCPAKKGMSGY